MAQAGGRARLAAEALPHLGRTRLLGRQDLDRDVAIERKLVREVDGAHPPTTEQPLDAILEADRLLEGFEQRIDRRIRSGRFDAGAARKAEPRFRRQHGIAVTALHRGNLVSSEGKEY